MADSNVVSLDGAARKRAASSLLWYYNHHERQKTRQREYMRERNASRIAKGECVRCGDIAIVGRRMCLVHFNEKAGESGRRQRARKQKAVALLGGKCMDCGLVSEYLAVYDFDHRDPSLKEYEPSLVLMGTWKRAMAELAKCDLVCSNCHRIRTVKRSGI